MDEVPARIEHTLCGPMTTWTDAANALDAAMREGMAVCLPPCHVAGAAEYAPAVDLTTVVGAPAGQQATDTKVAEARTAWDDGADDLVMGPNLGLLRAGEDDAFADEIEELVASVPIPVRVVVETAHLSEEERVRAASAASDADAAAVEVRTGGAGDDATVAAVEALTPHLPVTARGGIDTWRSAQAVFDAGAERIASTSGDVVVSEYRVETGDGDPTTGE